MRIEQCPNCGKDPKVTTVNYSGKVVKCSCGTEGVVVCHAPEDDLAEQAAIGYWNKGVKNLIKKRNSATPL